MAALERDLLLLPEDLDLGGSKAKRGIGDRGCYGHLVPAETCSYSDEVEEEPVSLDAERQDERKFMMTDETRQRWTSSKVAVR